jgi:metallophosphoesterase superfamily enzyme
MGHVHPVIVLQDPAGFRITRQVWVKARCNPNILAEILLQKHGVKIEKTVQKTLMKHYGVKPQTTQLFIMPSFNEFLGGKPLNEKETTESEKIIGPILRTEAVDLENAEIYLLDGTFLGSLNQLKTFGKP